MLYSFKEEIGLAAVLSKQIDKRKENADVLTLATGWVTIMLNNQLVALSFQLWRWTFWPARGRRGRCMLCSSGGR